MLAHPFLTSPFHPAASHQEHLAGYVQGGGMDWWEGKAFINNKYCKKLIDGLQSFLFGFAGSAVVVDQ